MEDSSCREMLLERAKENNINISFVSKRDMEHIVTKYIALVGKTCQINFTSPGASVDVFLKYTFSEPIIAILNLDETVAALADARPTTVAFYIANLNEWKTLIEKRVLGCYPIYITNLQVDFVLGDNGYNTILAEGTATDWLIELGKKYNYPVRCFDVNGEYITLD